MKAVAVNGTSNSGKTTVCEALIKGLRQRGYSVGSVKEIHHKSFAIDPDPYADTGRHRAAGSELITARGVSETDILYRSKLAMDEIFRHYSQDYLILEGVLDCNAPRIVTAHNRAEAEERIDGRTIAISGILANGSCQELFGLPVFNALENPDALVDFVEKRAFRPLPSFDAECCSLCGYSCRELAERIARQKAKPGDCVLSAPKTELFIDGIPVSMVPFVQAILKNAVLGVVQELDGFKKHGRIEVKFQL